MADHDPGGQGDTTDTSGDGADGPGDELAAPDTSGAAAAAQPPSRRSQKRALRKEAKEKLGSWWFATSHDPRESVRVVVEGDRIGSTSGNGEDVGAAIYRYSRLLRVLGGGESRLQGLAFGNSVILEFQASEHEITRAEKDLAAARQLEDKAEGDDGKAEFEAAVSRAVTDVHLAATMAAELLSVPSKEAPEAAASYGSDVAEAYRTLANSVAKADLTLVLKDPASDETVRLTPTKAAAVVEELRESTEPKVLTIRAVGLLSLADQEHHGFGLRLDPDFTKHPALKGKRIVRGSYIPAVEAVIRDQSLWGKDVRATIRVVRDALVSTSTIRPATYTLIGVEARESA